MLRRGVDCWRGEKEGRKRREGGEKEGIKEMIIVGRLMVQEMTCFELFGLLKNQL